MVGINIVITDTALNYSAGALPRFQNSGRPLPWRSAVRYRWPQLTCIQAEGLSRRKRGKPDANGTDNDRKFEGIGAPSPSD